MLLYLRAFLYNIVKLTLAWDLDIQSLYKTHPVPCYVNPLFTFKTYCWDDIPFPLYTKIYENNLLLVVVISGLTPISISKVIMVFCRKILKLRSIILRRHCGIPVKTNVNLVIKETNQAAQKVVMKGK